jgi:hypothetical protein
MKSSRTNVPCIWQKKGKESRRKIRGEKKDHLQSRNKPAE